MTTPLRDNAWFPISSSFPKQTTDAINELVDLKVIEKLNNEMRFTHEFMQYYDRVDVESIKKRINEEYEKQQPYDKEAVLSLLKMETALRAYLRDQDIHIDDNRLRHLILNATNLMSLRDAGN